MNRKISAVGAALAVTALLLCSSCGGKKDEATTQQAQTQTEAAAASQGAELYKSKTCFTCHGEDGNKPLLPNYPTIAGQNPEYALQQMKDIASGDRANSQSAAMKAIMAIVSEEEMKILADYVATMPAGKSDAAPLAAGHTGEELYKSKTCFTCHGEDAKSPILPIYPKIAGHSAEYALQQMKDIASGDRANSQSVAMKGIMHLVNEDEMRALAEYVATLER